MLVDDMVYFGCDTFKNVFKQLTANPKVEVLTDNGGELLRYDGIAKVVKGDGRHIPHRRGLKKQNAGALSMCLPTTGTRTAP